MNEWISSVKPRAWSTFNMVATVPTALGQGHAEETSGQGRKKPGSSQNTDTMCVDPA